MKTNQTFDELRREVKKLMVDRDLDCCGGQLRLAGALKINHKALNMALTGFRRTSASVKLLESVREYLRSA